MLDSIVCSGGRIEYLPSRAIMASGAVRQKLFFDYGAAVDVSALPEHIRWVPAIFNLAPMVWALGLSVSVPFRYRPMEAGLSAIRDEFRRLYPTMAWQGSIEFTGEGIEPPAGAGRTIAMYSGGLDSVHTIFRRFASAPTLVMLERSTISPVSKQSIKDRADAFASTLGLELIVVETNATSFFDGVKLGSFPALRETDRSWWTGVQFGVAIPAAAAPAAHARGVEVVYIASGFSEAYAVPMASSPQIDNHVCWPGCRVEHDSFDRSRQQKISAVIAENPRPGITPQLVVCNKPLAGTVNCGLCEKCLRTMAGLMVEGEDPRTWGFDNIADPNEAVERIKDAFAGGSVKMLDDQLAIWTEIVQRAALAEKCPPELKEWFAALDLRPHRLRWRRREAVTAFFRSSLPRPLLNAARGVNNWLLERRVRASLK